ncbi:hypothetical protein B0T24DRAFT_535228 [Lasiosphaeria ovina]|uniref:Uncharacterized protein n=1 Tax=Lasiosphaeria ovina TaxID=92902 RepID=A0AAE0JZJ8_9PEZI|nr:hypothetical protein B0T24DRAFT_535228 [Lasiosphaeria ovina]
MGFDCGFDIFPALEPTEENKRAYRAFLNEIIAKYQDTYDKEGRRDDGKVLELPGDPQAKWPHPHSIRFMVGECPSVPANPNHCGYFLRFSSKVSGRLTRCAGPYILSICDIARRYFGHKVHFWHELNESGAEWQCGGCYDWNEVHDMGKELEALTDGKTTSIQYEELRDQH